MKTFLLPIILLLSSCARTGYMDLVPAVGNLQTNSGNKDYSKNISEKNANSLVCNLFSSSPNLCVTIDWETTPKASEYSSFILRFYNPNSLTKLIDPKYSPFVVFTMPSMNHGTALTHKIIKLNEGEYRVYNIYLLMTGEWNVSIELKDGDNVIDQTNHKISI